MNQLKQTGMTFEISHLFFNLFSALNEVLCDPNISTEANWYLPSALLKYPGMGQNFQLF